MDPSHSNGCQDGLQEKEIAIAINLLVGQCPASARRERLA